jgi:HEAT repeat protein
VLVRREAANALSLSSDAPKDLVGPALLHAALTDADSLCREYAAVGIGRFASDGAVEGLVQVYRNDTSPHVRAAALLGMAWLDDIAALDYFEEALAAPDEAESRYIAGLGIVRLGKRYSHELPPEEMRNRMLPVVRTMLRSANERVRAKAVEAAGYYGARGLTPNLIRALGSLPLAAGEEGGTEDRDVSWEVRARAAEALGRLYELQAAQKNDGVAHIVSALVLAQNSDPEAAVRWKAEEALRRMAYNASKWGKLELTRSMPEEVVEGETAHEYFGEGSGHEHED